MGKQKPAKHIADIVGEWGRWQFTMFCFVFILSAVSSVNNMGYSFHAFDNKHWCSDVPPDYTNRTDAMKCRKFTNPNESCTEWQYDRSEFDNSIITEFNLVCSRSDLASISQSIFMMGYVVSGLVFAHYSDKYGRRPVTWLSFALEIAGNLGCAMSVNIYMYLVSRFLVGMGASGRAMAIYTILLETCGPKHRSDIVMMTQIGWVLGYALIPGLAYWLQSFRYMQFLSTIPMILMMCWFYFLYESPRWQICNGEINRAEKTLRKALTVNGKSDADLKTQLSELSLHLQKVQSDGQKVKNHTLLDLFRTARLRKITLIVFYSWPVNSLLYYGLSFNMSSFGGNFYITFLMSGLVELPSQLLSALMLRYIGRRKLYVLFMLITAVSCLAVTAAPNDLWKVTFALTGKFGISCSGNVFSIHAPELFPTILRHRGMGASSVVGRIGSIVAPFMKNLANTWGVSAVMIIYGTLLIIGAIAGWFLPETMGKEIPDTIEEAENRSQIESNLDNKSKSRF